MTIVGFWTYRGGCNISTIQRETRKYCMIIDLRRINNFYHTTSERTPKNKHMVGYFLLEYTYFMERTHELLHLKTLK
jgi:hypothetical protein